MEEDQQNLKLEESNQLALKDLLIKNDDEEAASSSKDNKTENEVSKESKESLQKNEEKCNSKPPSPPDRISPEPNCAICLEQMTNKSFTDSCFHMFCFTCLLEWSKVKAECPLCKQSFKSIVHNLRSLKEYDQYYIKSRMSENLWRYVASDRSFRYSTTLTSERIFERNPTDYSDSRIENAIASHRMLYAPHLVHSVRMYAASPSVRHIPCAFRRRIYDENLWVRPLVSGRIRFISPEFFRQNIACTHRLLPWLNRELLVVMPNNESQISFVIELIMALIVKYEITSQEFYAHIEPYILSHTSHFIHEFHYFAVSPYESMDSYDLHAQYSHISIPILQNVSSPDSDVIPLSMNESSSQKSSSSEPKRKKQHHSKKKHSKEAKRLKKIVLKRNSENNCWETISYLNPNSPRTSVLPFPTNLYEVPGPSTSRDNPFAECFTEISNKQLDEPNEVEYLGGKEDDECQVVDVLKPRRERTPEIIDLSSENEPEFRIRKLTSDFEPEFRTRKLSSDFTTVHDSSDEFDIYFSNSGNTTPSPSILSTNVNIFEDISENDDVVFVSESKKNDVVELVDTDTPIDYSVKTAEKETLANTKNQESDPSTSNSKNDECDISQTNDTKINDLANDDTGSSSWSPILRSSRKRRAVILDDSSTESCSESTPVSEIKSRIKKLKLKSVVAHFSFDPSDERDSTHHSSSHKKHKDRKKKKKKHKHKTRHSYASDSN